MCKHWCGGATAGGSFPASAQRKGKLIVCVGRAGCASAFMGVAVHYVSGAKTLHVVGPSPVSRVCGCDIWQWPWAGQGPRRRWRTELKKMRADSVLVHVQFARTD